MNKKTNHVANKNNHNHNQRNRNRNKNNGGRKTSNHTNDKLKNKNYLKQMIEKYKNLAKEKRANGEMVDAERAYQHMDHFQKMMNLHFPPVEEKEIELNTDPEVAEEEKSTDKKQSTEPADDTVEIEIEDVIEDAEIEGQSKTEAAEEEKVAKKAAAKKSTTTKKSASTSDAKKKATTKTATKTTTTKKKKAETKKPTLDLGEDK